MSEESSKSELSVLEKHVGKLLVVLLGAFILGTVGMIYSSDKSSALMSQRIDFLTRTVSRLDSNMVKFNESRWTALNQSDYSTRIEEKFQRLEKRVDRIENKP